MCNFCENWGFRFWSHLFFEITFLFFLIKFPHITVTVIFSSLLLLFAFTLPSLPPLSQNAVRSLVGSWTKAVGKMLNRADIWKLFSVLSLPLLCASYQIEHLQIDSPNFVWDSLLRPQIYWETAFEVAWLKLMLSTVGCTCVRWKLASSSQWYQKTTRLAKI